MFIVILYPYPYAMSEQLSIQWASPAIVEAVEVVLNQCVLNRTRHLNSSRLLIHVQASYRIRTDRPSTQFEQASRTTLR